ncbi:MAG: hypothetical protein PHX07_06990, partial [Candidatus Marinimicrobia bacterium]|nr:hypothetical protein [Candidatus Neomarinimicrobiota bacterium]
GFGPTEIRIFIVLINTIIFFHGAGQFHFRGMEISVLDIAAIFLTAILFIFYIVSVIVDGKKLQREEEKEREDEQKH